MVKSAALLLASLVAASTAPGAPAPPFDLLREPLKGRPHPPATARDLQAGWDFQHYDIALALDPAARRASGTLVATVQARQDGPEELLFHGNRLEIGTLRVDGATAAWVQDGDEIRVAVPGSVASGDVVEVEVTWTTRGTTSDRELGLHWGSPIYTFSEPDGTRNWLPVYDAPADKATLAWHVTAPSDLVVVANGEVAGTDVGEGTTTWHYDFPWPIATYLMVVNAGDFEEAVQDGPVPVVTHASPSQLEAALESLGDTPGMISFLSDLWFPYPFTLYGNVLVPFGGAMEHTTRTSFGSSLVGHGIAELVNVHELGHQWWGDTVTCAEWADIWLNEGFASYTEALWYEHLHGAEGLQAYTASQRESYLAWHDWEGVFALYDPVYMWGGTVYDKGAFVLHMLRFVMGDDRFFAALRDYGAAFMHDVVTTPDLQGVLEARYGDLDWFFEQWVYRAGDPSYRVGLTSTDLGGGAWQVDVHVVQTGDDLWAMPVEWTVTLADGSEVTDLQWVSEAATVVTYCVGAEGASLDFDSGGHLLYEDLSTGSFEPAPVACGGADTGDTAAADTGSTPDDTAGGPVPGGGRGCGCGVAGPTRWGWFGWLALGVLAWRGRRRG